MLVMVSGSGSVSAQSMTSTETCDVTIGIAASGVAYDATDVSIEVGQTVCWIWENESMEHNVAQVADQNSNEKKSGGLYSGAAATTVDFRHTFTEDETFYYVCEPHVTMDMRGVVVVGNGTPQVVSTNNSPSDETPGFGAAIGILSLIGALMFTRSRTDQSRLDD